MTQHWYAAVALGFFSVAMLLRAVNRPHARSGSQNTAVWSNHNLEHRFRTKGNDPKFVLENMP